MEIVRNRRPLAVGPIVARLFPELLREFGSDDTHPHSTDEESECDRASGDYEASDDLIPRHGYVSAVKGMRSESGVARSAAARELCADIMLSV
jgi:hypothetical protein